MPKNFFNLFFARFIFVSVFMCVRVLVGVCMAMQISYVFNLLVLERERGRQKNLVLRKLLDRTYC